MEDNGDLDNFESDDEEYGFEVESDPEPEVPQAQVEQEDVVSAKVVAVGDGDGDEEDEFEVAGRIARVAPVARPVEGKVREMKAFLESLLPSDWKHMARFITARMAETVLVEGDNLTPRLGDIFRGLPNTRDVRLCVIGQEPYSDASESGPYADGIAFSSRQGARPSYRTLALTLQKVGAPATSGNLAPLVAQGAAVINTCWTGRLGSNNMPHADVWSGFTRAVLDFICAGEFCVFWTLGRPATETMRNRINRVVFGAPHPSPLNEVPAGEKIHPFLKLFKGAGLTNQLLHRVGRPQINWSVVT